MFIGSHSDGSAHAGQSSGELVYRKFKLAHQHAPARRHLKPRPGRSCRKTKCQIGNQQRFADLRFAATKEDSLRGQESRFNEAGLRSRLQYQEFTQ
jgi:hypothetical protein